MFYPTEARTIIQARALTNNAVNRFSTDFPLDGTGWTVMRITLHALLTTTGTGTIYTDGIYRYIKGILLRTSRGETIVDNVPGQAMAAYQTFHRHITPRHDRNLGTTATTVNGVIEIPFCQDYFNRPEDTIFDSGRYSNLQLDITTGGFVDFCTTGTTIAAVTMDIEIENTLSALSPDGKSKPYAHAYFKAYGPNTSTAVTNLFDLESSLDLGLFGFMIKTTTTGLMACSWDGPGVDVLTNLTFRDSVRRWVDNSLPWARKQVLHNHVYTDHHDVQDAVLITAAQPWPLLGCYPHSFVNFGSINEHYATGKKSLIRVDYGTTNATDVSSLLVWGMRALR